MMNYVRKKISELNEKSDTRIAVTGKIIKSSESKFILEDDSGRVEINFDNADCVAIDNVVRAFCAITNGILKAEAVQNLSGLDMDLFMKIEDLYRKAGLNV